MGLRGRAAALALAGLSLAGCGGGGSGDAGRATTTATAPTPSPSLRIFAYDASRPLGYRDAGRVNSPYPIAVDAVSYAAPSGRVQGYLAAPEHGAKLPAVIYLHGSGESRERFLLPAVWAAGKRAVGMTLTLPSSTAGAAPAGLTPVQRLARDQQIFVADVVAVRRAVDVLRSLPRVDPGRIGLVGWSLGARVAAVAAGAEPHIKAVVLMSGGSLPVSEYAAQAPAGLRPEVRRSLTAIDPLRWLARAHAGSVLLQDGRKDEIVPRAALVALQKAAPQGSVVRWYQAGHDLNAQVYRDQLAFLAKVLPIAGPPVPGAKTGP
ncbi:MAG TPA: acetylxylan esterase [Gaiellaceae bacterium]|nr:acetylxylan esterase [Gaiellaceae bacterium]